MNKILQQLLTAFLLVVLATLAPCGRVFAATSKETTTHHFFLKVDKQLIIGSPYLNAGPSSYTPTILLKGSGATPFDTTIQWTNPTAARTYTIPDGGGNVSFMLSNGGTFTGSLTVPSLILTATSFNATVNVVSSLGQATTFSLPDPGAATDNILTQKATQSVTGAKTFSDGALVGTEGTGTGTFNAGGKLFGMSAVSNSSTGGAVDTTYTLPANSLVANGKSLHVVMRGTTAANANNKTVNFKFGSTTIAILSAAASNAKDFYADISIYRTGSSAQQIVVDGYANGALLNGLSTTSTQTETGTIAITGDLATATANNDAVLQQFEVYAEP